MPDALPAVTVPFSLANTAFSLAMPSSVDSPRTCSSVSNGTGPFRVLSSIGRICSLKCPAAIAAAARWWLWTANASCCSRVMPHLVATFSAVTPMCTVSNGSVSAPTIMSRILPSPIRWPQRPDGSR